MATFEEKLAKVRQGYNEKLNVDDKEQMANKDKSVLQRLREMFNFGAPPPAKKKQ